MRRLLPACWLALFLAVGAGPAAAAPTPPLDQKGRWVTDARGRVVMLHGVNMVYKRPPYHPEAAGFDSADARFLAREGFNTVRLGIIYKGVEPSPGRYDDAYLERIRNSLRVLARHRIFSMLDFHQDLYNERFQGEGFPDWAVQDDGLPPYPQAGFPGNYIVMPALNRAFDHFWANSPGPGGVGLQDRYAAAWRHVARRFRNEPHNMGYDLLNEPWPGTGWQLCANNVGCPAFDRQKLTPFSQRVFNRIREVDRRNLVWYEPNVIYNNGPDTHHGNLGRHSGMSFHIYCLGEGFTPTATPADPGQAEGCDTFEELPFRNANKQSEETNDTSLLTEFGATDDVPQIERLAEKADKYMIGWQYWHYCECSDPTTAGSGGTQSIVRDIRKSPSGSNVKTDKLAVLARPYPQTVAGQPLRFDFDREPRRFDLTYSTRRAGGGRLAFNADTQISVPRRHYPRGYDVRVTGGEALSTRNSTILRVRNCTGRRRVTVAVTPGRGRAAADCRAPRTAAEARRRRFRLQVRPRRLRAGKLTRVRFRATVRRRGRWRPLRGVRIRFGKRRLRTNRRGRARVRVRISRTGRFRARARRRGYRRVVVRVRVVRPRRR